MVLSLCSVLSLILYIAMLVSGFLVIVGNDDNKPLEGCPARFLSAFADIHGC